MAQCAACVSGRRPCISGACQNARAQTAWNQTVPYTAAAFGLAAAANRNRPAGCVAASSIEPAGSAVRFGMGCREFAALGPTAQRAYLARANPTLSSAQIEASRRRLAAMCSRTRASGWLRPSGTAADPTQGDPKTSISDTSWAQAANSLVGTAAETVNALISGAFGAEAARLARDGQIQAAMLQAQTARETNELERIRLQNAQRELELRAQEIELRRQELARSGGGTTTRGDGSPDDPNAPAVPAWAWAVGGVVVIGGAGALTFALLRKGGKKKGRKG
jgi:hypothetical protein